MIGKLRHRLILQRLVLTDDGFGGGSRAWEEVARVWGSVRELSVREEVLESASRVVVRSRVVIRFRAGVEAGMRFVRDGGRVLDIVSVLDELGRGRFLTCLCEEGAS